jgi:hypothetical protein
MQSRRQVQFRHSPSIVDVDVVEIVDVDACYQYTPITSASLLIDLHGLCWDGTNYCKSYIFAHGENDCESGGISMSNATMRASEHIERLEEKRPCCQ